MKTIKQLKILFSPKDVSYKSHQVSAASVDYSRSSRRKPEGGGGWGGKKPLPVQKIGLGGTSSVPLISHMHAQKMA